MLAGASINNRVGTTRIISYHSANHCPVRRGSFGSKIQTVWFQEHVELIPDHTWLHAHPFFFLIYFEDFSKIFRNIDRKATSELQSHVNLVCRLLLEKKKKNNKTHTINIKQHI